MRRSWGVWVRYCLTDDDCCHCEILRQDTDRGDIVTREHGSDFDFLSPMRPSANSHCRRGENCWIAFVSKVSAPSTGRSFSTSFGHALRNATSVPNASSAAFARRRAHTPRNCREPGSIAERWRSSSRRPRPVTPWSAAPLPQRPRFAPSVNRRPLDQASVASSFASRSTSPTGTPNVSDAIASEAPSCSASLI